MLATRHDNHWGCNPLRHWCQGYNTLFLNIAKISMFEKKEFKQTFLSLIFWHQPYPNKAGWPEKQRGKWKNL